MHHTVLYKQLEKTLVIPHVMRTRLLKNFKNISENQKIIIQQVMHAENSILLDLLVSQKKSGNIPASTIKEGYIKYKHTQQESIEKNDQITESQELNILLQQLR